MKEKFRKFALRVSNAVGTPTAFLSAVLVVLLWALTGPVFGFSDTWQLIINTGTTIVTFLMVFLIQNSQNRDSRAFHLKLNELLKGVRGARTELVDLEEMSDEELEELHAEYRKMHEDLHSQVKRRGLDPEATGDREKKSATAS